MNMPAQHRRVTTTLGQLLAGIGGAPVTDYDDIVVDGIASDSRNIAPGFLFLAYQGISSHGMDYLEAAIANGAVAVVYESETTNAPQNDLIPSIGVGNLAAHIGTVADRFFGMPSASLDVVGVTGTNGKTTVAWMVAACQQLLNHRCGYIGTLGAGIEALTDTHGMTTPAVIDLQMTLSEFAQNDATHAAIEVSSHALSQGRVDGVRFAAALFTNLTRDHLDYHGDMESYFACKASLFKDDGRQLNIINVDTAFGERLAKQCGDAAVRVSSQPQVGESVGRYVALTQRAANDAGWTVSFDSHWGAGQFELALPGRYNIDNALLCIAYLLADGNDIARVCDAMSLIKPPPGRMQRVCPEHPAVFVDYAHTPDALKSTLTELRGHTQGKLWAVFGCGGDRDQGKRSEMGQIAAALADQVVVTNDNPRSESPDAIIADIIGGVQQPHSVVAIADRATAISWAISNATPDDIVLIAGKGHEDYQLIGDERLAFSDHQVALAAMNARQRVQ